MRHLHGPVHHALLLYEQTIAAWSNLFSSLLSFLLFDPITVWRGTPLTFSSWSHPQHNTQHSNLIFRKIHNLFSVTDAAYTSRHWHSNSLRPYKQQSWWALTSPHYSDEIEEADLGSGGHGRGTRSWKHGMRSNSDPINLITKIAWKDIDGGTCELLETRTDPTPAIDPEQRTTWRTLKTHKSTSGVGCKTSLHSIACAWLL